jgi:hypothetical protein
MSAHQGGPQQQQQVPPQSQQQQQQQQQGYSIRHVNSEQTAHDEQQPPVSPNFPYGGMASGIDIATSQYTGQQPLFTDPRRAPAPETTAQNNGSYNMYPIPTSRSMHHIPQQSVDMPDSEQDHGDALSTHSRSALHTPQLGQHAPSADDHSGGPQHISRKARFNSSQLPHVAGRDMHGAEIRPVDFAEKGPANQRSVPPGYKTPPTFSRQSSGWQTPLNERNNPYSQLGGGAASESKASLQFADGDAGKSKFARFWLMILSTNIVVRWLVFILPVLALLWIPGICGVTINPTPRVWRVSLLNWSIWLTIAWLGWWAGMIVAMLAPHFFRHTVGVIAPEARHYIDYLACKWI